LRKIEKNSGLFSMAIAKKKKKFWDVEIPLINKTTQLYAFSLKETEGRIIKYDLTRILKGKNALLSAEVKIEGDEAKTVPREIQLLQTFVRKIIRKRTNYIEDSFSLTCKDAELKIKPLLVTRRKVSRAVRKALREKVKSELIVYVKNKDVKTIFEEILKNQLQKSLSLKLKKTYPLSVCEIRVLRVEKRFEPAESKKSEKKKENPAEKAE
jgi:ribosomal protein S3AE